ncbi:MAG: kynureninase [Granulosicoccaceae bacterium]
MSNFEQTRQQFVLTDGQIYFAGNSLGPAPKAAAKRVLQTIENEWSLLLVKAWNSAGWMDQPDNLGNRLAAIIGATPNTVTTGDTLSIKVFQALSAAVALRPERRVILSDSGNFPTDLYMAGGLVNLLQSDYELRVVAPEDVADALSEDVAVVMLTQVDYRTGRLHDMKAITQGAHDVGALTLWDLAHSAGAIATNLDVNKADFAVGCTYKFLNAGPGSPAFIYVAPHLIDTASSALSGWLGHAQPFAFDLEYQPAVGIRHFRVGTPSVLAMASLEAALDVWAEVDINDVHARSIKLSELFIRQMASSCPSLTLASPSDPHQRGSQVSFNCSYGYPLMQALIAADVIGDFRAPDIVRFGITPLFINENDILKAVEIIRTIVDSGSWDKPEFHARKSVT